MRSSSRVVWALLALALVSLGAGCFRPYRVVQQAVPNPFLAGADFRLAPLAFQGLQVGGKTEASYLAGKDKQSRSSWEADKQAMADFFMRELVARASGTRVHEQGRFVIEPLVTFIEPGFYVGIAKGDAEVQMSVQIKDSKGALLDVFDMGVTVVSSMANASVGQRLRSAAGRLGSITATYLNDRTRPQ